MKILLTPKGHLHVTPILPAGWTMSTGADWATMWEYWTSVGGAGGGMWAGARSVCRAA